MSEGIKLNNIVANMRDVVDKEWKIVGQAPDGLPVYEALRPQFRNVPDIDPETGKQRWQLHESHGHPMYPRRRLRREEVPFQFTVYDPGNGNVRMEPYTPPTPEELRERDMAARKHALMADLVHGLAARNVSVDTLLNHLAGPEEPEVSFPLHKGGPNWELSNGERFVGSRVNAVEAEAALHLEV